MGCSSSIPLPLLPTRLEDLDSQTNTLNLEALDRQIIEAEKHHETHCYTHKRGSLEETILAQKLNNCPQSLSSIKIGILDHTIAPNAQQMERCL